MADGQTELDKKIGNEPADVVKSNWVYVPKERPAGMSDDDKIPVKQMPFRERSAPFKITGGGNGG